MAYEISEVKTVRKKLGMTQAELASKAGVSQSLVAKIEAGLIDPAHSKAVKIFGALNSAKQEVQQKLGDVMQKKLICARPSTSIREAISLMKDHSISQMPVMQDGKCIGLVTESVMLDALVDRKLESVGDVMAECPPIVSRNAPATVAFDLLKHYPTILVSEQGKIVGIVTRSDMLSKMAL